MDKATRNNIQRATQQARRLLEDEFREQLEGTYDILLDGTMAHAPGSHLSSDQQVIREKLMAVVRRKMAIGLKASDAVSAYIREAVFTTLNRFVALKMLESRSVVQGCISQGEESSGYKEFMGLAPGLVGLGDDGYRLYIESLFDEIAREIRVLFDRRDPASLLWPRRQTLDNLLTLINDPLLSSIWEEDETIGWVYQYFNGDEERRKMRDESQAPRNSHELAVRNQFFTPRYVVQFLTDNTLGRIWCEMMRGKTKLSTLAYLIHPRTASFLADAEEAPLPCNNGETTPPVYIRSRAKKDPRDLRILDPACGSGHFLLYAFDLFITIYEEAWADHCSTPFTESGRTIRNEFAELDALRRALPSLILRYNLYGIDIDPRAAQIAAFALWLRTQRYFNENNTVSVNRPPIAKTNIVAAEPMPGDQQMLQEFIGTLATESGQLVEKIFKQMELAGEVGYLLRIDDIIKSTIRTTLGSSGELFRQSDAADWKAAEVDLLQGLREYSKRTPNGQEYDRRLFVEDAERGFGLIDLSLIRFDVLLMNPPFGEFVHGNRDWATTCYPTCARELYAAFVLRALELAHRDGFVGALTSRTGLSNASLAEWREKTLLRSGIVCLGDLGGDVLDGAVVETAAYVLGGGTPTDHSIFIQVREESQLKGAVDKLCAGARDPSIYLVPCRSFLSLAKSVVAYWLPAALLLACEELQPIEGHACSVKVGLQTGDDFRFVRCWWEVPAAELPESRGDQKWVSHAKGGENAPFYSDIHLLVNWANDGYEIRSHKSSTIRNSDNYLKLGLTFPYRTNRFSPSFLPAGCITGVTGMGIFPLEMEPWALLTALNSSPVNALIRAWLGRVELDSLYQAGTIQPIPFPSVEMFNLSRLSEIGRSQYLLRAEHSRRDETSTSYDGPWPEAARDAVDATRMEEINIDRTIQAAEKLYIEADKLIADAYGLSASTLAALQSNELSRFVGTIQDGAATPREQCERLLSFGVGLAFDRWSHKKSSLVPASELIVESNCVLSAPPILTDFVADQTSAHLKPSALCADPGHPRDLTSVVMGRLKERLLVADPSQCESLERHLTLPTRDWFQRHFFEYHIKMYSRSRRKAPIYWQLATASASYSVWIYYHRLSRETLYQVLNDYIIPKIQDEDRKLNQLQTEAGLDPSRSQRILIDDQSAFIEELRSFRVEVARVAPLWNPDLNDGALINFAPMWRLVPHNRDWQKVCRGNWNKLKAGNYDWARLAMHLWPERVVPKCAKDRSLAIAHGLEDVFWFEDNRGKWYPREVQPGKIDQIIKSRTSPAVKAALHDLLSAPTPSGSSGRKRKKSKKATKE